MGKSGISISSTPEGMPRPSLLSAGAPAVNHNILDSMARHVPLESPPARSGRWLWLMLPVLAAAGWFVATQRQQPAAPLAAVVPSVQVPLAVATPAAAPSPPAETTTVAKGPETSAGNPFNSLEPAAPVAAVVPASAPAAPVAETPVPAPSAATAAAKAPPATEAGTPVAAKSRPPKTTPVAETKTAKKPEVVARADTRTAVPAAKKPNGRDPDVELLSAIMKHLGEDATPPAAPARSAQTIADLVKSCKRKDPIEAMLCQRRICEGSWGKAQACPPSLAPKAVVSKSAPVKAAAAPAPAPTFITEANPAPARR